MIQKFQEFTKQYGIDIKSLISEVMLNMSTHKGDNAYMIAKKDGNSCRIDISGTADMPMSDCTANIVLLVMPPNFKPNLLADMRPSTMEVKDTTLDEYKVITDEQMCEGAREFFNMCKDEFGDLSTITVNIRFA